MLSTLFVHQLIFLSEGRLNRLVAVQDGRLTSVPLAEVAGRQRLVPLDDPLIIAARDVGTCFGEPV